MKRINLHSLRAIVMAENTPEHKTEVNGITIHYTKNGKGRPLLLLHGWTQSSAFWHPYINDFKRHFEVYAIDLRGHGKSSPLTSEFSIQHSSEDVLEFIRRFGLSPVCAIGLSFGGLILLEIASKEKSIIDKMVLIGTASEYDGKKAGEGKREFTFDDMDQSLRDHLLSIHAGGEKQVRSFFNTGLDYRINISEEQLKKITAKTFIIQGDRDEIVGKDAAPDLHRNIPHSQLWIIPDTGHLAIQERTRIEFVNKTMRFLTGG